MVTFCVIRYIFPRVQVAGVNWPDQNNFVLPSCSGRLSKRQLGGWWWAGATIKETSEWQVFSGYGALESGQQLRWGRYRDWDEMTFGLQISEPKRPLGSRSLRARWGDSCWVRKLGSNWGQGGARAWGLLGSLPGKAPSSGAARARNSLIGRPMTGFWNQAAGLPKDFWLGSNWLRRAGGRWRAGAGATIGNVRL